MSALDWFSQRVGYPLIVNGNWRRDKDRRLFRQLLQQKQEEQFAPLVQQRDLQLKRLRSLLLHAGEKVPYYHDLFAELRFDPSAIEKTEDIQVLPILTRELIQDNQDRLLVSNPQAYGARPNSTGGSTGCPLNFYQCTNYGTNSEAALWMSDMVAGRKMGSRTAILWGAHRDTRRFEGLKGFAYCLLHNRRYFDAYDMSLEQMHNYYRALQRFQPEVLIGYASSLDLFACFLRENRLAPSFPRVSIITSAEVLSSYMRETLEEVFRVPIFDRYGSRELSLIAYECEEHNGLHLNLSDQYAELRGNDPYHEPAEIVTTSLNNYAMPFIRYRIGDMAVLSDRSCTCGRSAPLLQRVDGRMTDTITTKSGKLVYGGCFRVLFWGCSGIRQYQFIQESLDKFVLKIVPADGFEPSLLSKLRNEILQVVGKESTLAIELVDHISPAPSGKHLFVISKVPLPISGHPAHARDSC